MEKEKIMINTIISNLNAEDTFNSTETEEKSKVEGVSGLSGKSVFFELLFNI